MQKISTGVIIALATTGIFLSLVTAGLIATQTISSNGTVTSVNVGVYSDFDCTENCTSISWGTVSPDDSVSRTVYVKNTGTVPVTLTMTTASWVPTNADDYLTLTWNRQDTVLNAGQSISATLTLTVEPSTGDLEDFSFDIVITGAE